MMNQKATIDKSKKEKKFQIREWSVILTKHDIISLTACFSAENVRRNRSPRLGNRSHLNDNTMAQPLVKRMEKESIHSALLLRKDLSFMHRFRGYDHTPVIGAYALRATQSQQC